MKLNRILLPGLLICLNLEAAAVTFDGAVTNQVIDGFGVNANHRSWNNDELKPVLDALIDQAGMTLFRVVYDESNWESTNDNADSAVMDWTYYNPVYSSAEFSKMWNLVAYLNGRGITTNGIIFNFMGPGPTWMGGAALTSGEEDEWAEMITSLLVWARYTNHLQFQYVGPDNEPDISNEGITINTATQYTNALHKLAVTLDANGLSDIRLVAPDLAGGGTTYMPEMMADPVIMSKLGHFGVHSYSGDGGGSSSVYSYIQSSPYADRTFWMTEFNVWCSTCDSGTRGTYDWSYCKGTADYLLNHLENGASGGIVWEGYDSYYLHPPTAWSFWGLFSVDDENVTPKTYTPRKNFYTLAQISKWVRPGAYRIAVSGTTSPFTPLLAFKHSALSQVTVVGINTSSSAAVLNGTLASLPAARQFDLYYTSATTNLAYGGSVTVNNGAFSKTIPADCVFTLVGSTTITPTNSLAPGVYQGLFYDTNRVAPQSSGFFEAKVTEKGAFSAKMRSGRNTYSVSGQFLSSGIFSNAIPRKNSTPLSAQLQVDLAGGNVITGQISDGNWTAELAACRAIYNAKTNPAPQSGNYTLLIPGAQGDSSEQPGGDSPATVKVNSSGKVKFVAALADGTKASQAASVFQNGQWPLYASLYSGNGLLIGWLTFTNTSTDDLSGLVCWIKPPQPTAKFYSAGFTNETVAVGSRYAFTAGVPILNFNRGQLLFENGNLADIVSSPIVFETQSRATGANTSLSIRTSSGLFTGSLLHPTTGVKVSFSGVILQKQNYGYGYFLGTDQSGRVFLGP